MVGVSGAALASASWGHVARLAFCHRAGVTSLQLLVDQESAETLQLSSCDNTPPPRVTVSTHVISASGCREGHL